MDGRRSRGFPASREELFPYGLAPLGTSQISSPLPAILPRIQEASSHPGPPGGSERFCRSPGRFCIHAGLLTKSADMELRNDTEIHSLDAAGSLRIHPARRLLPPAGISAAPGPACLKFLKTRPRGRPGVADKRTERPERPAVRCAGNRCSASFPFSFRSKPCPFSGGAEADACGIHAMTSEPQNPGLPPPESPDAQAGRKDSGRRDRATSLPRLQRGPSIAGTALAAAWYF